MVHIANSQGEIATACGNSGSIAVWHHFRAAPRIHPSNLQTAAIINGDLRCSASSYTRQASHRMIESIVSPALTRKVQIPQQALFACQDLHTGQEPLQPLEVDVAFHGDQFLFPSLTRLMPLLRDLGCALSCVGYADLAKPGALNESFIFSRRTVHVKSNRAACGDFFVGNHSADYQGVAEQHPSARLQYAKHLTQHLGPIWNMAQNVIREYGIKSVVIEGESVRNITLLETGL